jgi:hypothetical protein
LVGGPRGGSRALSSITSALFILLAVGALIGTWNLSGTIPSLVYYGIQALSPGYFYVATAGSVAWWRCRSAAHGQPPEQLVSASWASRPCWECRRRSPQAR